MQQIGPGCCILLSSLQISRAGGTLLFECASLSHSFVGDHSVITRVHLVEIDSLCHQIQVITILSTLAFKDMCKLIVSLTY